MPPWSNPLSTPTRLVRTGFPVAAPYSRQAHVGLRITLTVFWTFVFLVGLAIGLLLSVPGFADAVQRVFTSTIESTSVSLALAVGLVLLGLWGIASSHRNLRHSVDVIAEVDRARKETIQLESTRYMQQPK